MARELIRSLYAWDITVGSRVQLHPGLMLTSCRIHRNTNDSGAYLVTFVHAGRSFQVPLVEFQARTTSADWSSIEENPAREALTA